MVKVVMSIPMISASVYENVIDSGEVKEDTVVVGVSSAVRWITSEPMWVVPEGGEIVVKKVGVSSCRAWKVVEDVRVEVNVGGRVRVRRERVIVDVASVVASTVRADALRIEAEDEQPRVVIV